MHRCYLFIMMNERVQPPIVLASKSPRRKYLLEQAGISVEVVPSSVDEDRLARTDPGSYARILAEAKARDVAERRPHRWVIGADTIVVAGEAVLGKPGSETEARQMLRQLSGQRHRVITGWCICRWDRNRLFSGAETTEVRFKALGEAEIDWYVNTGEPFDKAGAYAIQGLGTFLVKSIRGSYTNVVGLPVCEIIEILLQENILRYRDPTGEMDTP